MEKINLDEFIKRSKKIHGDKYDYSKVSYDKITDKVCIICPEHGEFWIEAREHYRGQGCQKCGIESGIVKRKLTKEEFIEKARKIHGNKYDYSKVEYVNNSTKVKILCPIHGEFEQTPKAHLNGYGCRKCGRMVCAEKTKMAKDEFIEKAIKVHGDKYDYSKVKYTNAYGEIIIICPIHGEFKQVVHDHLKGAGCPECGKIAKENGRRLTLEEFVSKSKKVHGDKYDYSKVEYKNNSTSVKILCPIHGEFEQAPGSHMSGQGCPECAKQKISVKKRMTKEEFIEKARNVHGDKYDYSNVVYSGNGNKVIIKCFKHGNFEQTPHDHLQGTGCPKCGGRLSKNENEIYEFCNNLFDGVVEQSNRKVISPYELDIFIPNLNIGIEYNGLLWHSTYYCKDKNRHLDKLNLCKQNNIKLIQIFEDEYINNKDIVLNKLKHILGKCDNLPKIPARKCEIKEINKNIAKEFLDKYHIQGFVGSTVYLGCYYNDELIGVMTFKRERNNGDNWELSRFASDYNYICQGVGGKLFKYFVKKYNPNEVKSFADRRWTSDENNNLYTKLGFKFDKYTPPDYHYFKIEDGLIRQHKFSFRKQILNKKYGLSLSMTEKEMCNQLGYEKIYDCGLIKYVWKNKN